MRGGPARAARREHLCAHAAVLVHRDTANACSSMPPALLINTATCRHTSIRVDRRYLYKLFMRAAHTQIRDTASRAA